MNPLSRCKQKKPVKFKPADQELKDYVGNLTFGAFMIREISSIVPPENFSGWALRDSFLIHARTFLDFFTKKKENRYHKDIMAVDYSSVWNPESSKTRLPKLEKERDHINTFLAHFSQERQEEVYRLGHKKQWPEVEIATELQKEWDDHFRVKIDPKFKTDFPEWKLILFP